MDVLETERAVLVLVALPGVDIGEVKALIEGGTLTVAGIRNIRRRCRRRPSTVSSFRKAASSGALVFRPDSIPA